VNTHVPLPWFFLGHVPLLGAASTPTRFAAVMMLGMTALFGLALAGLADRAGSRGGLSSAPSRCPHRRVDARASDAARGGRARRVRRHRGRPRPISVLHLPFGFRDGTRTVGYYDNARQYYQTTHGKRLIGGYLSRLTRNEVGVSAGPRS